MKEETRIFFKKLSRIFILGLVIVCCDTLTTKGQCGEYNNSVGGELTCDGNSINEINGQGTWIIWGVGQDVTIQLKNGEGSLTLRNFKNITIVEKNGKGNLIVEDDNESVKINKMDGEGSAYLRVKGTKRIGEKNGSGNIYFKGATPIIGNIKNGKVVREV